MKKIALNYEVIVFTAVCLAAMSSELQAGASSVTGKDASGATVIFDTTTDAATHNVPWQVICDATAAANCVSVNSSGQIAIGAPPSLPLPAGAATSASQASVAIWASSTLGAITNYGTGPGAVLVPGVNAAVTTSVLPTGGATSSNQATISSTLTTISALSSTMASTMTLLYAVSSSINVISSTISTNTGSAIPAGSASIGNVGATIYPAGATAITAVATGSTAATTATLASSSSLHTYICGFSIRANATAAASSMSTLTGVVTGTMSFLQWTAPNTAGIGVTEQIFNPCIVSSASNQAIAVVSAAPGTGGLVSVAAWGYTGPN